MLRTHHYFLIVGSVGFIVDLCFFKLFFDLSYNPYLSRLGSFVVAVCATFILNNRITFRDRKNSKPVLYLFTQSIGLGINMLVFSLIIWQPFWFPKQYYLGLVAGSLAAMFFNYEMSRHYVFK